MAAVLPLAPDLDVCLVHSPTLAHRAFLAFPKGRLQLRRELLDPAVNVGMVNLDAALAHHFLQVPVAEGISEIPTHTEQDNVFFEAVLLDKALKKRLKSVSWQLAGVAVLADWLGSNQDYFNYCDKPKELNVYWHEIALEKAKEAIGALPKTPEVSAFQSIKNLFDFIQQPTPLQHYAITEPLTEQPQLFILEDVTGAGKTEAALILTQRLMAQGLADGLYIALPTMATANAMYKRLGNVYRKFYQSGSEPSLILAHGARELSQDFQDSVVLAKQLKADGNYLSGKNEEDQELSATAYCNAWLADSRKKALLADVGVGTLDQTLLAVLPARHQSLSLLGFPTPVGMNRNSYPSGFAT